MGKEKQLSDVLMDIMSEVVIRRNKAPFIVLVEDLHTTVCAIQEDLRKVDCKINTERTEWGKHSREVEQAISRIDLLESAKHGIAFKQWAADAFRDMHPRGILSPKERKDLTNKFLSALEEARRVRAERAT